MLQNSYILEYSPLLPTEKAVQRYPVKKCLKHFPEIYRKQVFSCKFLEHFGKTTLQNTREQLLLYLLWLNFFKNISFL